MSNSESKRVYMDYAAATPVRAEILDIYNRIAMEFIGNPSSLHESGYKAKKLLDETRRRVGLICGVSSRDVIFTASGTEANNLAITGVLRANKASGRHCIISSIEHASIRSQVIGLEKEGFEFSILPADKNGRVELSKLESLIREDTVLVSVIYVNNETGVVQDIRKIGTIIKTKNPKTLFHTDACQASGYFSLHCGDLKVDLMTINSSKIYAPRGVGCLIKKGMIRIEPLVYGGDQEFSYRAGTENLAGIVAFGEALKLAQEKAQEESERLNKIRNFAIENLKANFSDILILDSQYQAPHILAFALPSTEGERMVLELSKVGFDISTGSACSVGKEPISHVVKAINVPDKYQAGVLRLSFGINTIVDDVEKIINTLKTS